MSSPPRPSHNRKASSTVDSHDPPTIAAFSPETTSQSANQRATILVQQKSPLLVATPPQITRALAYSHPFILPLNRLVGLLSWTSGDPWESFLLVAAFWATCLYGDFLTRWAAPLILVAVLSLAMYVRRYSQLSSTGWTGEKRKGHKRAQSDVNVSEHKSLEDIVDALRLFTSRCNILLDPFLRLTNFLSTQTTATAATTRPALTALFIRIVLVTPIWILLTLSPLYILTTKRVILCLGTIILTWHSQPARVTRTIFWRSATCRKVSSIITGLDLSATTPVSVPPTSTTDQATPKAKAKSKSKTPHDIAASLAVKSGREPGIRLTFTLYENQRRWLGIGWTSSLLAYERTPWTDEHLNSTSAKDKFNLPPVDGGHAKWVWAPSSDWHVLDTDGQIVQNPDAPSSQGGWIYYDNKWQNGKKGKDSWGRYTRRRRWCRDAELVEISPSPTPPPLPVRHDDMSSSTTTTLVDKSRDDTQSIDTAVTRSKDESEHANTTRRKKGWFSRRESGSTSEKSLALSSTSRRSLMDEDEDIHEPLRLKDLDRESSWGVQDDTQMGLG